MAWIFVNNSNIPVNIGLFNAGILYQWKNHVQPYSSATSTPKTGGVSADDWLGLQLLKDAQGRILEPSFGAGGCAASFDTAAIGYDIAIVYDTPGTEYDSSQNWSRITEISGITIGALLTAAGIALIWVPVAGEAVTVAGITITAGAIATTGAVSTAVGTVLTLGDIAVNIAQTVMTPAKFIGWYGAKDYGCVIKGGFTYDTPPAGQAPPGDKLHITGFEPLKLRWENADTGESGTASPNW
jgi:hypothetical protein